MLFENQLQLLSKNELILNNVLENIVLNDAGFKRAGPVVKQGKDPKEV